MYTSIRTLLSTYLFPLADCNWLSEKQGLEPVYPEVSKWGKAQKGSAFLPNPANGYRLPTDAEWEYAAGEASLGRDSSGLKYTLLAGSDSVEAVGWFLDNSGGRSQQVASKEPNRLGLYDMSGNIREWRWDWYGLYEGAAQENPLGPLTGTKKVVRGGDWGSKWRVLRISDRGDRPPGLRDTHIGFRVVRSTEASK